MERKGSAAVIILIVLIILLIGGGAWYYEAHRFHNSIPVLTSASETATSTTVISVPSTSSSTTTTLAANVSTTVRCGTDFSDFAVPPLPTNGFNWIQATPTNATVNGRAIASFDPNTEEAEQEALSIDPRPATSSDILDGNEWFAEGEIESADESYYLPILTAEGWSHETHFDGYDIWGLIAGGANANIDGYVKIENGYLRSIVLADLYPPQGNPNYSFVFVSDIVPISKVIPDYQPNCPAVSTSPQFQNGSYIKLQSLLPGTIVTDPSGKRVGYNEITTTTYNEMPDASYSNDFGDGDILVSDPASGNYTVTLTAETRWYSGYSVMTWVGGTGSPMPYYQELGGNITNGETITYNLSYNPQNAASTTITFISSSTAGTASASATWVSVPAGSSTSLAPRNLESFVSLEPSAHFCRRLFFLSFE